MMQGALRWSISFAVAISLSTPMREAGASGGANSKSDSSQGSSDGSKNSSNSSGDSSKKSGENSDNSSEDSTKNSSKDSSDKTSDSSKSNEAKIVSVVGAIVVVGLGIGVGLTLTAQGEKREQVAQAKLVEFLERYHAMVTRDLMLGEGPVLAAWAAELGLAETELSVWSASIEGSEEQTRMLESLSSELGPREVRAFAREFCALTQRALGDARMRELVEAMGLDG